MYLWQNQSCQNCSMQGGDVIKFSTLRRKVKFYLPLSTRFGKPWRGNDSGTKSEIMFFSYQSSSKEINLCIQINEVDVTHTQYSFLKWCSSNNLFRISTKYREKIPKIVTQVCKCLGTKLNPRDTLATWELQTSAHHHVYHFSKHKWNNNNNKKVLGQVVS